MFEARHVAIAAMLVLQAMVLVIPGPIEARVSPGANIIIETNAGFSNPYVTGAGTQANPYVLKELDMGAYNIQVKNTTSYVLLKDITFTTSTRQAFYFYNADNVVVQNASCSDHSRFLYFGSGSNLILRDSRITNVRSNLKLVDIVASDLVTISNCTFTNRTGETGSYISFDNTVMTSTVERCTLRYVGIRDQAFTVNDLMDDCSLVGSGIAVDNTAPGATIRNCRIDYPGGNCISLTRSKEVEIKGNHLTGSTGIYFSTSTLQPDTSDYGRIDNNTFEKCAYGIDGVNQWQNQPSRYEVTDNYFGNCTNYAINWNYGTQNRIWDNIFYHNKGTLDSGSAGQVMQGFQWGGNNNFWTYGGKGNFWQNHRTPDADNNGIVDVNYTITGSVLDTAPYTNIFLDAKRPSIAIKSPSGAYVSNFYTVVTFECSDEGSGISSVQRSYDGQHWHTLRNSSATSVYLKKGPNEVRFKVTDRAGLANVVNKKWTLNSSIEPLRFEVPVEGSYIKVDPFEMRWMTIFQLKTENLTLELDGDRRYLPPSASTFILTDLAEGPHQSRVSVRDPYGMYINRTANFTVDLTPPQLTLDSPQDGSHLSNPLVNFNIRATDNIRVKTVTVTVDGEPWATFNPAVGNSRFMGPGLHTFTVSVVDSAGWSVSEGISFYVDEEGTDSNLTFISPAPGGTYTQEATFTVKWDYTGTFSWTRALLRVGAATDWTAIGTQHSYDISLAEEAKYDLALKLEDVYGNYVQTTGFVVRDTTVPRVYVPAIAEGARLSSGVFTLNWTVVDESPVTHFDYTVDGGGPNMTEEHGVALDLAEGPHTIDVRAYDAAGNVGEIVRELTIDLTPTEAHFVSPSDGAIIDGNDIIVRWEVSDPLDISNMTLTTDDGGLYDIGGLPAQTIDIVDEGQHTLTISCTDRAGNAWTESITIMVDRMDPEVGWGLVPPEYTNTSALNLTFYATDRVGIAHLTIDIDGNVTNITGMAYLVVVLPEGPHNLTLRAVDLAGKATSTERVRVIVDLKAPALDVHDQTVLDGKASLAWEARDDHGVPIVDISVDGGKWTAGKAQGEYTTLKLPPGAHTIRLRATDQAMNRNVFVWYFNVTSDGGIDGPKDEGGSFPWWIVPLLLVIVLLLILAIAVVVLRKRPKEEEGHRRTGPRKLSIGAVPAAIPADIPPASLPEGVGESGSKVEEAEDGTGYIRPKAKERPVKKPREIPHEPQSEGPDRSGQEPSIAPSPAMQGEGVFMSAPAPADMFTAAPATPEGVDHYPSPPAPDGPMFGKGPDPPSDGVPPSADVAFDEDGPEEFEEMEEFETLEE